MCRGRGGRSWLGSLPSPFNSVYWVEELILGDSCRNAAWNAFTALIDVDTATLLSSSPFADPLIRRLMAEIASVSRALGIEIDPLSPDALPSAKAKLAKAKAEGAKEGGEKEKEKEERLDDKLINRVLAVGPLTSSMRTDVQSGRSLEVEVRLLLSSLSFSLSLPSSFSPFTPFFFLSLSLSISFSAGMLVLVLTDD